MGWLGLTLLCAVLSACSGKPSQVEIRPSPVAVNAPCTQHDVIAHVTDAEGKPVCNCLVEWTLPRSRDAVGAIVDTPAPPHVLLGKKKTNTYARTMTDRDGNARITITSSQEGRTPIIALVPWIKDKKYHKVFAVKHWLKAAWEFPPDQSTKAGQIRQMTTRVYRSACDDLDGPYPLPGYQVDWEILAHFQVTEQTFDTLQEKEVPDDVIQPLRAIEGQQFLGKKPFLRRVAERIGKQQTSAYQDVILASTEQPIGPPVYFKEPETGKPTTHITIETNTTGHSSIALYKDQIAPGQNKIAITIRHPDQTEELCCPHESDVLDRRTLTQTWTPAN